MNSQQNKAYGQPQALTKTDNKRKSLLIIICCVAGAIILIAAIVVVLLNFNVKQSPGTSAAQPPTATTPVNNTQPSSTTPSNQYTNLPSTTPPAASITLPPASTPPSTPSTPASTPASTPPSQPAPVSPTPSANPTSSESLISKDAYTMVLTLSDMGTGWQKGTSGSPAKQGVVSASTVSYIQGSSFAPSVQNTVAVYRSIQVAMNAYDQEKPAYVTLTNPQIGDECFLNSNVAISRELVFRKNNVVVWVWVQQYKTGDIESYARIVESRITP